MSKQTIGPIIITENYEPNTPCIYLITNLRNNKVYVGSCLSIRNRLGTHNANLRKGKASPYMQNDYDKNKDTFSMSVLEYCEASNIIEREQHWINVYYDIQKECYNINPTAYSNLGMIMPESSRKKLSDRKKKITLELLSPEGEVVEITGITKFCKQYGIFPAHLLQLRKGLVKTCKGWRLASDKDVEYIQPQKLLAEKLQKTYDVRIVGPDELEYGPITNMRAFCREHSLSAGTFRSMIKGEIKIYNGWRLYENKDLTKEDIKKERIKKISNTYDVKIISPTNEVFGPITNLNSFCKEHGLNQGSMDYLIKGKKKSYKGWRLLNESPSSTD